MQRLERVKRDAAFVTLLQTRQLQSDPLLHAAEIRKGLLDAGDHVADELDAMARQLGDTIRVLELKIYGEARS